MNVTEDFQPTAGRRAARLDERAGPLGPMADESPDAPQEPARVARGELLFTLDGVDHYAPDVVSSRVLLRFAHVARANGELYALSWLLEEILGAEAYEALMNSSEVEDEDVTALFKFLKRKLAASAPSV